MADRDSSAYRDGGEAIPPRVFLRPIGSPLPLALAGLAVASLLTTGADLGWISLAQTRQVGFLLLVAVAPIQLLACGLTFLARDGASASGVGVLGATWAAYGLTKLEGAPGSTSGALGLVLVMAGAVLLGAAVAQGTGKLLPGVVVALAGARFAISGVYELSGAEGWQDAAGAVGLAVAAGALYLVWALELEDARDRPLLPTLRRGRGRLAVEAGGERQLDGVEHEPGVRAEL